MDIVTWIADGLDMKHWEENFRSFRQRAKPRLPSVSHLQQPHVGENLAKREALLFQILLESRTEELPEIVKVDIR